MEIIEQKYNHAVNSYIKQFERNSGLEFDSWAGDKIGEIAFFGDYSFNFSDVKYVVDNDISIDFLVDWYWFIVEYQKCYYNLDAYCKLRRDSEKNQHFCLNAFEKKLIYMRIPG